MRPRRHVRGAAAESPAGGGLATRPSASSRDGMGAVLKGRDVDLGRYLAIKVLLESHKEKPELVKRFVEEAQIGGQLQHPGIVPVYELGSFGDRRPFFTMKLVKGRTLHELLNARSRPADDWPRLLSIFESIAQTVAYAHSRGVIHQRLEARNVMVGAFGEVQVMDWGLANALPLRGQVNLRARGTRSISVIKQRVRSDADASLAGSVLGTPGYMALEQTCAARSRPWTNGPTSSAWGRSSAKSLPANQPLRGATRVKRSARRDAEKSPKRTQDSRAASLISLDKMALAAPVGREDRL